MNPRMLALLAVGHMTTDVYHLTYAQTGTIVLAMQAASSLIQPLFGYLSDRWERIWLAAVPLLALPFSWALPADAPVAGRRLQEAKTATR